MILALLLLATTGPQAQHVPDETLERVRTAIEQSGTGFAFVETRKPGNITPIMIWRMASPPESNRSLSEGARANREDVAVTLANYGEPRAAKQRFDSIFTEVGRGSVVRDLGDEAVMRRISGNWSHTTIDFTSGQFVVSVSAPNGPVARRFARLVADTLLGREARAGAPPAPANMPERVRASVERSVPGMEYLTTELGTGPGGVVDLHCVHWYVPPATGADAMQQPEMKATGVDAAAVYVLKRGSVERAKSDLVAVRKELGKGTALSSFGTEATLHHSDTERETSVAFRLGRYIVVASAPSEEMARRCAHAAAGILKEEK